MSSACVDNRTLGQYFGERKLIRNTHLVPRSKAQAENLLHRRDDRVALTEAGESGVVISYHFRQRVRVMAAALKVNGLKVGDRVTGGDCVY